MKSAISVLIGAARVGEHSLLGACAFLGFVERLAVVFAAIAFTSGASVAGAALLVASTAVFAARRGLRVTLRVRLEACLHRVAARALLGGDVVTARPSGDDPQAVVFDGALHGAAFGADVLPQLASDALASAVLAVLLIATRPAATTTLFVLAVTAMLAVVLGLRQVTARLEQKSLRAYEPVQAGVLSVVRGRLEIVARGREAEALASVDAALRSYTRAATGSAWASALLGRIPMAAAAVTGAVFLGATGRMGTPLGAKELGDLVVLGSALPAFAGLTTSVHGLARGVTLLGPLVRLLGTPARTPGRPVSPQDTPDGSRVTLERVSFAYDDGVDVLRSVDATFDRGTFAALVGANGAGKSTLLRLVVGLATPTEGRVRVGGRDAAGLDVASVRRTFGYLPQRPYLGDGIDVRSAIRMLEPADDQAMLAMLDAVELGPVLRAKNPNDPLATPVAQLSAGQRQRLALARVLLFDASVLALDEPDADLDLQGLRVVRRLLRDQASAGKTVIVAAHAPELLDEADARVELTAPRR